MNPDHVRDTAPDLIDNLAAGNPPSEILIAQAMLTDLGPDGLYTDSGGNVWSLREGKYVSVNGFVYKIRFDQTRYQISGEPDSLSYIAAWPD